MLYENKDLAPKIPTLNWLGLTRSRTEAVTIVAHGGLCVCDGLHTYL
jgi:hypothetical protein